MYKVDSPQAEEFIHHEEILETLEYARSHKDNRTFIEQLIEKAALCKGLTHREAATLLECDQPDLIERIFHLAKEIKQKFYGNRIVMFAPLYLSNYCVNVWHLKPANIRLSTHWNIYWNPSGPFIVSDTRMGLSAV